MEAVTFIRRINTVTDDEDAGPLPDFDALRVQMEETIHVFVDSGGALRARHSFAFWTARFLTLRYEITMHAPRASGE